MRVNDDAQVAYPHLVRRYNYNFSTVGPGGSRGSPGPAGDVGPPGKPGNETK